MDDPSPPLTALAHGGGCGCKLAPSMLRQILAGLPPASSFPDLLVGMETGDDAAVWRLDGERALVATTDFFTPIVDDPTDFGRIAATNALSDIYAMGGTPILALAILGMPVGKVALSTVRAIAAGGAAVCADAGIPLAGGHSIDSAEPIYGLAAVGLVDPRRVLRNAAAQPGDVLILTKGLGIGVFSAALKQGELSAADYETMVGSATRLNRLGQALPGIEGVHAATDVTGFGLLGHTLEMCRGSGVAATVRWRDVPVLPGAAALAARGVRTGAAQRNWESDVGAVTLPAGMTEWERLLLCDPQTSGGLLVTTSRAAAPVVLARAHQAGFERAAIVGELEPGEPAITVR